MTGFSGDFDDAAEAVARAVERSVAQAVSGERNVAVAFSGGLDSSILAKCAMVHAEVFACAAYTKKSGDAVKAHESAEAIGISLVATELTTENVGSALAEIDLPFVPTLMDRSLWSLYRIVSRTAHDSGARVMLLGQLADELFGGYSKYEEAVRTKGEEEASRMMEEDIRGYASRGRIRDLGACSKWVEPRFPFEAREVVELALSLPLPFKIRNGVRKAVLRRAASLIGVPRAQADATKKAAQYSSGVQKLVGGSPF